MQYGDVGADIYTGPREPVPQEPDAWFWPCDKAVAWLPWVSSITHQRAVKLYDAETAVRKKDTVCLIPFLLLTLSVDSKAVLSSQTGYPKAIILKDDFACGSL